MVLFLRVSQTWSLLLTYTRSPKLTGKNNDAREKQINSGASRRCNSVISYISRGSASRDLGLVISISMLDSLSPSSELLRTSAWWASSKISTLLPFGASGVVILIVMQCPSFYTPLWQMSTLPLESYSLVTLSKIMLFFIACSPHSLGQLPPFWWRICTSFIHVQWARVPSPFVVGIGQWPSSSVWGFGVGSDTAPWWWLLMVLSDGFGVVLSELWCGIFRSLPPSCAIVALFFSYDITWAESLNSLAIEVVICVVSLLCIRFFVCSCFAKMYSLLGC